MKTVCAWCGLVLKDGTEPVSHGICVKCNAMFFKTDETEEKTA